MKEQMDSGDDPDMDHTSAGPRLVAHNDGLVARNIGKQFKKRPVLRDVTVRLQRGEAVGLLGPNGAGTTTCVDIITGLIAPDYGDILLDGQDVTDQSGRASCRARGGTVEWLAGVAGAFKKKKYKCT